MFTVRDISMLSPADTGYYFEPVRAGYKITREESSAPDLYNETQFQQIKHLEGFLPGKEKSLLDMGVTF
ncbi:hypothetical protein [Fervidobacterium thailandense]|uniref:Uncharacterized protein n=1 Tax=Fervidobacterium thailandense TaxID=1008305 RepID=A0A1E3G625_9BACT|nr:hypothetical protein [Fervidobacterium thailandense]ODN31323.1 hypothetical protein A4H02_00710 [Fervidobacterium thailandense]